MHLEPKPFISIYFFLAFLACSILHLNFKISFILTMKCSKETQACNSSTWAI